MRQVFLFLAVFVLGSVLTTDNLFGAPQNGIDNQKETQFSSNQPIFSTDTDLFLGQRRRSVRIWTNFYFGATTLEPKEAQGIPGGKIKPDYYGIQLGLDMPESRGGYSTFFFNANQSDTDYFGLFSSTIDNFLFGYGKYKYFDLCHFALTGSVGYDGYEISAQGITGDGGGLQTNIFGEFGLDFIFGKWGIKPFYALQYDFMYHGKIDLVYSGQSLEVCGDWNGHGLQQLFGLRLNWKVFDMLELQGRTVWVHEFLSNPPPFFRGRFSPVQGTATPAIMFYNGYTGRDWAWLGLGAKFEGIYGIYFFGDYDLLINDRHTSHLGSFGLCLAW